jgi:hypothetical protein
MEYIAFLTKVNNQLNGAGDLFNQFGNDGSGRKANALRH